MMRAGSLNWLQRRWFAAGLCIAAPLLLATAGGVFSPCPNDNPISNRHADRIKVTDSTGDSGASSADAPPLLAAGFASPSGPNVATALITQPGMTEPSSELALMEEAKNLVAEGRARYAEIHSYSCLFTKRERMKNGRLVGPQVLEMKARTNPRSIYFRFVKPHAGREAIWVDGQFGGKMLVHDVGLGKLLAGTLKIEPNSSMAMEDNRHPITDAGLGYLLDELAVRWAEEMQPGSIDVTVAHDAMVGDRPCIMVESTHPDKQPEFLYHKVKVYFDKELLMPIRFEAYDWPKKNGKIDLVEEYMYVDLKLNPGLDADDFDPANSQYSFGRF